LSGDEEGDEEGGPEEVGEEEVKAVFSATRRG
jgi:hypothetical protein